MKFLLFLLTSFLFLSSAFSQTQKNEVTADAQVQNAIEIYKHYTRGNAPLYNGREYLYYTFKMEGIPFFGTADFVDGWVNYDGRKYDSVALLYDIVRNELVVLSPDKKSAIVMHNELVDSFSMLNHTFIYLNEDHKQNLYNTSFYDLLYDGKDVQFLERRVKTLNPRIVSSSIITSFPEKNRFYIHKKGLYYLVSNKKDVYRVFSDKARDLKKLMRQNHLKIKRKTFETSAAKASELYDQLTH